MHLFKYTSSYHNRIGSQIIQNYILDYNIIFFEKNNSSSYVTCQVPFVEPVLCYLVQNTNYTPVHMFYHVWLRHLFPVFIHVFTPLLSLPVAHHGCMQWLMKKRRTDWSWSTQLIKLINGPSMRHRRLFQYTATTNGDYVGVAIAWLWRGSSWLLARIPNRLSMLPTSSPWAMSKLWLGRRSTQVVFCLILCETIEHVHDVVTRLVSNFLAVRKLNIK